jgi:DNA-binding HxlR family transcriptional regulator
MQMSREFRCDCPFTSALDVLGDRWILVIVKQMLVEGKETFKDFTESEEAIATNILSAKLKHLQDWGIVNKTQKPGNRKTNIYYLTDKGLNLTPVLMELAIWSDSNLRNEHPTIQDGKEMELLRKDKAAFSEQIVNAYRQKRSVLLD